MRRYDEEESMAGKKVILCPQIPPRTSPNAFGASSRNDDIVFFFVIPTLESLSEHWKICNVTFHTTDPSASFGMTIGCYYLLILYTTDRKHARDITGAISAYIVNIQHHIGCRMDAGCSISLSQCDRIGLSAQQFVKIGVNRDFGCMLTNDCIRRKGQ